MEHEADGTRLRRADIHDLAGLVDLERAASTVALGHVFGDIPFPMDDVTARWALVLADPGVTTLVVDPPAAAGPGLVGFVAFDTEGWLRHLGVHPSQWGRGLGRQLHDAALDELSAGGGRATYLWVLEDNHRARAFYRRLGWHETGVREPEVFEPFPVKLKLTRPA